MFHICPLFSGIVETWQALPVPSSLHLCRLVADFLWDESLHLPISSAYETHFEHVTHIHAVVLTVVQMCQTSCAIHIHVIVFAAVQMCHVCVPFCTVVADFSPSC
jgi:hypothetical protein